MPRGLYRALFGHMYQLLLRVLRVLLGFLWGLLRRMHRLLLLRGVVLRRLLGVFWKLCPELRGGLQLQLYRMLRRQRLRRKLFGRVLQWLLGLR